MLIDNHTSYPHVPTPAIGRAARWVLRQLDMQPEQVRRIRIGNRNDGSCSGHIHLRQGDIYLGSGRICVDQKDGGEHPVLPISGWGLVAVDAPWAARVRLHRMMQTLAHEIAHRYLYLQGKGVTRTGTVGASERETCWHHRWVMRQFEPQRQELLDKFLGKRWVDQHGRAGRKDSPCV